MKHKGLLLIFLIVIVTINVKAKSIDLKGIMGHLKAF